MTQNTLETIDQFATQLELREQQMYCRSPRPHRKHRGHGGRRQRRVGLGINGRNASRSVNQSMRSVALVAK